MEPSSSTSTGAFDQHVNMCESTDEESSWFEKSIGTEQEEVPMTDSPHDKLNVEFTQDELNTELSSVNENTSLTSVFMPPKLTEVLHDEEESVELMNELSTKHADTKHQELIKDLTKDDDDDDGDNDNGVADEGKTESVDIKVTECSQLEGKLKEKPSSRDISDELSEMFFDVNDLHEEATKKDKLDEVLEEKLSELDSTEPPSKGENTEEAVADQELMNAELENSHLEISQLNTSLIDNGGSCDEIGGEPKELEPHNVDSEISVAEPSAAISEDNLKSSDDKFIINTNNSQPGTSSLKQVPNFDMDVSDEVCENIKMNKESIELNEERMMVEFTHDDNEGRVVIQINENVKQDDIEQQNAGIEDRKGEPAQENIVATAEEASISHMNERYILQEDEIAHVEGGAEFLEAVTGDIDKLLLETSKPQSVEPVKSTPIEAKPKPALTPKKCFVLTCKSGRPGSKNINCRYFTPPTNLQQFKKWEIILVQGDQELKSDSTICECHFNPKYFYRKSLGKDGKFVWGLKEGAIPRLNNTGVPKFEQQRPAGVLLPSTPRPAGVLSGPSVAAKSTSQLKPKDIESMKKVMPKPEQELSSPEPAVHEEADVTPSYLIHNPDLIKYAQEEISSIDVLVCGECHSVCHFIEEFQEHKFIGNCRGQSTFKANLSEPKPQVWAFLLWKSAQSRVLSDIESSWKLYQRWCKMDENVRDTWIAAGKSIQDGTLLASIKIGESKVGRPGRPPISIKESAQEEIMRAKFMSRKMNIARSKQVQKIVRTRKSSYDSDDIEEDKVEMGAGDAGEDVEQEEHIDSDDMTVSSDGRTSSLAQQSKEEAKLKLKPKDMSQLQEPTDTTPAIASVSGASPAPAPAPAPATSSTITPAAKSKEDLEIKQEKAEIQKEEEEEFVVEKIVSRRYNSKLKRYEYLLKWEGYPSEQNTWEPMENLETCKHLLKDFEASLAREQALKNAANQKQAALQNQLQKKKTSDIINQPGPSGMVNSLGRPVRSSKQKALDQVKVWCGSMAKGDDDDGKRKMSSDSEYEEDLPTKKIKVEHDSEDSVDMDQRRGIARKYMRGGMRRTGNDRLVNGVKKEGNLAAALGLESDSDEETDLLKKKILSDSEGAEVVDGLGKRTLIRKMSSLSPQNQQVLVANAKGVVKVDHSQVPNLTSGVYIMSNRSGIIKLDNMSNKAISTLQKQAALKKVTQQQQQQQQQQKGGVVVLSKDANKDGNSGTPQKSGIIRRVPPPSPSPSSASHPVPILPKTPGATTPRPAGILKPSAPSATPRLPGLSSGVSPKIPVRPRGTLMSSGSRMRTPVGNLLRPGVKPIESMLGGALQVSSQQRTLLAKKKGIEDDRLSALEKASISRKFLGHHLVGRGIRGGRGLGGRGRSLATGRGGSSLSTLLKGTDLIRELPIKDSKLVENDNLLMEFQEQSESEDSDDGVVDPFPNFSDLPPIVPDSPPRPLTLCPLTGKVLAKAEGEKTPEPTPPPSPTSKFNSSIPKLGEEHPGSILPDNPPDEDNESSKDSLSLKTEQVCKVEMSPGGTTGTVVEGGALVNAITHAVEGGLTMKKAVASRSTIRGPQLSVLSSAPSTSTPIGTITVPARKLFHQEGHTAGEEEDMVTITGEDGLVYQVQVSNADMGGNALLVSSGEDGQQQCVYVTTEGGEGGEGDESTILTLDTAYADAVAQLSGTDQVNIMGDAGGCSQFYIKEGDGGDLVTLDGEEGGVMADDQGGQVVAQLVEAGEPAPGGGPRRVVLLLPDGNLMMTEVDEEQYAALDLDK